MCANHGKRARRKQMADYGKPEHKYLSEPALRVFRFQKKRNFWRIVLFIEGIFIIYSLWGLLKNIFNGTANGSWVLLIILWSLILGLFYLSYHMYSKNKNSYDLEVTPKIESDIIDYQIEIEKQRKKYSNSEARKVNTYTNSDIREEKTYTTDKISQNKPQNRVLSSLTAGIFPSIKILKMSDGTYTVGDDSGLSFQKYIWDGKRTKTTSKTTMKGRKGKTLAGAAIGATVNPAGAIVGGLIGANGKKKSTTTQTEYEKSSKVTFIFKTRIGNTKSYSCNIKSNKIHDIEVFFS